MWCHTQLMVTVSKWKSAILIWIQISNMMLYSVDSQWSRNESLSLLTSRICAACFSLRTCPGKIICYNHRFLKIERITNLQLLNTCVFTILWDTRCWVCARSCWHFNVGDKRKTVQTIWVVDWYNWVDVSEVGTLNTTGNCGVWVCW